MRRLFHFYQTLPSTHRANGMAVGLALMTLVGLRLEYNPSIAGADYRQMVVKKSQPVKLQFAKKDVSTEAVSLEAGSAGSQSMNPATAVASLSQTGTAIPVDMGSQLAAGNASAAIVSNELPPHLQLVQRKVKLLREGLSFLQSVPDYTGQFTKQELVAGELTEEQSMYMKIRHQPFSVYLKWLSGDEGREVLFVAGENSEKMIVHAGGWKARLPAISIEPESSMAMAEARYPVTKAGLLELARLIVDSHAIDMKDGIISACDVLEDQTFGDRPCTAFQVEYASKEVSPSYRKTITIIDNEWKVPVSVRNYAWPSDPSLSAEFLDDETLVEAYGYTELSFNQQLASADFDSKNEEYRFRR